MGLLFFRFGIGGIDEDGINRTRKGFLFIRIIANIKHCLFEAKFKRLYISCTTQMIIIFAIFIRVARVIKKVVGIL